MADAAVEAVPAPVSDATADKTTDASESVVDAVAEPATTTNSTEDVVEAPASKAEGENPATAVQRQELPQKTEVGFTPIFVEHDDSLIRASQKFKTSQRLKTSKKPKTNQMLKACQKFKTSQRNRTRQRKPQSEQEPREKTSTSLRAMVHGTTTGRGRTKTTEAMSNRMSLPSRRLMTRSRSVSR